MPCIFDYFAVTELMTFGISMNMVTIPDTPAVCRAPTSYTRAMITTSGCSDNTDGKQEHAMALHHLTWIKLP